MDVAIPGKKGIGRLINKSSLPGYYESTVTAVGRVACDLATAHFNHFPNVLPDHPATIDIVTGPTELNLKLLTAGWFDIDI